MLQHRDLDGVRLAHHGTVDGRAPRPRLAALDLQVEDALQVHDVRGRQVRPITGYQPKKVDLAVRALEQS